MYHGENIRMEVIWTFSNVLSREQIQKNSENHAWKKFLQYSVRETASGLYNACKDEGYSVDCFYSVRAASGETLVAYMNGEMTYNCMEEGGLVDEDDTE